MHGDPSSSLPLHSRAATSAEDIIPEMYFDSESLQPSLYSPEPLLSSGGNINSMCDQYLDQVDISSTKQSLGPDHEVLRSAEEWQAEECLAWAQSVLVERGIDLGSVDLWGLRSASGRLLQQYSEDDFVLLVGHPSGALLHHSFQELQRCAGDSGCGESGFGNDLRGHGGINVAQPGISFLDDFIPEDPCWTQVCGATGHLTEDLPEAFSGMTVGEEIGEESRDGGRATGGSEADVSVQSLVQELADLFHRIPANRNRDRRPKSWEFIVRLLKDSRTNPALIRWEDEATGCFRMVKPKLIAKIFGTVFTGKANLSQHNFARALRYFYKSGIIQAVPSRQLVYRCGPEALEYLRSLQQEPL